MTAAVSRALLAAGLAPDEAARRVLLAESVQSRLPTATAPRWYHVPGRIEVLGKHTDYTGGRSLVCATEQGLMAAAVPRNDAVLRVTDAATGDTVECRLDPEAAGRRGHWGNYPAAVAARFARDFGPDLAGFDLVFRSDIPVAAGVSSSSALVTTVALALIDRNRLADTPLYRAAMASPIQLAAYLGAVENGRPFGTLAGGGGVGTLGGSQDHTAILCARAGFLTQCRFDPPAIEREVAWPPDLLFLIASSGVAAEKSGATVERYNALARTAAELGVLLPDPRTDGVSIGRRIIEAGSADALVRELHDALQLAGPADAARLSGRLSQLMAECRVHVPAMADAVSANDLDAIGRIAAASHAAGGGALGNLILETRALAEMALAAGAVAASAFGAGFGGSVWAIVPRADADRCLEEWRDAYRATFPEREAARFLSTRPGPGALRIAIDPENPGS